MDEWKFNRVQLKDQELIKEYFRKYPSRSCDRTFFGVMLWGRHYNLDFAFTGKAILFREKTESGYGFAWPDSATTLPYTLESAGEDARFKQNAINIEEMAKFYKGEH